MSSLNIVVRKEFFSKFSVSFKVLSFYSKNQNLRENLCRPFCLFNEVGLRLPGPIRLFGGPIRLWTGL